MSKLNQKMSEFGISSAEEMASLVAEARQDRRHKDRFGQIYTPNHINAGERWKNVLLSTVLITYGTYGALHNDIYIPGKRSAGLHFHGIPLWFVYGAMLTASANLLSVVIDHYDKRNNERNYRIFARATQVLGWGLLIFAFILDIFVFHASSKH